ncbi:MAG: ABC transporter permease [Chloroflexota bacterium]|nr:ABC transporter permease [Chloroflexota bacterium]
MNHLRPILWLLPRHIRSSWISLSITGLGVLIAIIAVGLGHVYTQALSESGLQYSIANSDQVSLNIRITTKNRPIAPSDYSRLRTSVEEVIDKDIQFLLRGVHRIGRTQPNITLITDTNDVMSFFGGPAGRPFFLTNFKEHVKLIKGNWPQTSLTPRSGDIYLETVISQNISDLMHFNIGDTVFLMPYKGDSKELISVKIVGLVEPIDKTDEYWMGTPTYFDIQNVNDKPVIPLYIPEEHFLNVLGFNYPNMVGDYEWLILVDTSVLSSGLVDPTQKAIKNLETNINKTFPRSTVLTYLENSHGTGLLSKYQRDRTLAQVPVFLFISLVLVVIFYFLILMTSFLNSSRIQEAALLNSRGIKLFQTVLVQAISYLLVVVLSLITGPIIVLIVARYWLITSIPSVSESLVTASHLSGPMFLWMLLSGILSFLILIYCSSSTTNRNLTESIQNRARPPTKPFVQKYYIDVLAVIVFAIIFWQTGLRGGFVRETIAGTGLLVDPSLLLGPCMAFIACGLFLMRLVPYLTRVLSLLSKGIAPAWITYTLMNMSRDPFGYSSITVILMLSTSLGIFGSAFQPTLSKLESEQKLYEIGGDMVLSNISFSRVTQDERLQDISDIPGINDINPISREQIQIVNGANNRSGYILAAEIPNLHESAWFRDDFSRTSTTLQQLLDPLNQSEIEPSDSLYNGIIIPDSADSISVRVYIENIESGRRGYWIKFSARLMDTYGHYRNVELGEIDTNSVSKQEWQSLTAELPSNSTFKPPIILTSIFMTTSPSASIPSGTIYFDELSAKQDTPGFVYKPVNGFNTNDYWATLPHNLNNPDSLSTKTLSTAENSSKLIFSWTETLGQEPRGIFIPSVRYPLPAISGPGFSERDIVHVRSGRELVPLKIMGSTDYFPTLNPSLNAFFIVPIEEYLDYVTRIGRPTTTPDEFWISLDKSSDREFITQSINTHISRFAEIQDREAVVDMALKNPLAGGAWNSLTIFGIIILGTLTLFASATHSFVTAYNLKVDIIVNRTLGLSRLQLVLSVFLEKLVICTVGISTGVILGYFLSRWVLSYLDLTSSGRPAVPPMVFTTDTATTITTILVLVIISFVSVAIASFVSLRHKASDVLRVAD